MTITTYHAELAWLGGPTPTPNVLIQCDGDRISKVMPNIQAPASAKRLSGLTLPGLANTHSHVFHRAIRGHTQSGAGDFWAWRERMYDVAGRLDPDSLYALAHATYVEMALAGITSVGEFHYLHHDPSGSRYADPNLLGRTVAQAAVAAGLRITLLDACYLTADVAGSPLTGVQRRFDDGSWESWRDRVAQLGDGDNVRHGAAIHSVRAVPRDALAPVASYAAERGMPLHFHLSEQPAENAACLDAHGVTPTQLLHAAGALRADATAVHATHLTDADIELLGATHTSISMCATTERDLADGVGPAVRLLAAGAPLCVGSDGHMMIDLLEETRAIELDERLVTGKRGHLSVEQLLTAVTSAGAKSIGWDAGVIEAGRLADFTSVRLDSVRTAGSRSGDVLAQVVFAATGSDITDVIVGGRSIVSAGAHFSSEDPGGALDDAVARALGRPARGQA